MPTTVPSITDYNNLRTQVLTLAADVAALKTTTTGLQAKDTEHDAKLAAMDVTLDSVDEGLKQVFARVGVVETGYTAVNAELAVLKPMVTEMKALVATLQAKVTALEQKVGGGGLPAVGVNALYVPLFIYPGTAGLTQWQKVADLKAKYPTLEIVACVNPSNGIFTTADPGFVKGVDLLVAAGVICIGYVYTKYGNQTERTKQSILDNIMTWRRVYPKVTGIFFDEMHGNMFGYYKELTDFAKSQGFVMVWGNPGAPVEEAAVGCVDTILIYEDKGVPTVQDLDARTFGTVTTKKYPISNFGMIPHTVPTLDTVWLAEARKRCKYVYITSDTMMNPWDTLPTWLDPLAAALVAA